MDYHHPWEGEEAATGRIRHGRTAGDSEPKASVVAERKHAHSSARSMAGGSTNHIKGVTSR
jgi:hypothetical protein